MFYRSFDHLFDHQVRTLIMWSGVVSSSSMGACKAVKRVVKRAVKRRVVQRMLSKAVKLRSKLWSKDVWSNRQVVKIGTIGTSLYWCRPLPTVAGRYALGLRERVTESTGNYSGETESTGRQRLGRDTRHWQ